MDVTTTILRTDLILMMLGLRVPESPNENATEGSEYYCKDGAWRELKWNWDWFGNPRAEASKVKFRTYLLASYLTAGVDPRSDFMAVPGPIDVSVDLISKSITPDDVKMLPGPTVEMFTKADGYSRAIHTALSLGFNTEGSKGKIRLGIGIRRRVQVWQDGAQAEVRQCDLEFYMDAFTMDLDALMVNLDQGFKITTLKEPAWIQMGLAVSAGDTSGSPKSLNCNFGDQDISAFRVFGKLEANSPADGDGKSESQVQFQTRSLNSDTWTDVALQPGSPPKDWDELQGWANGLLSFEKPVYGIKQLLEAPMAPTDLQRLSWAGPSTISLLTNPTKITDTVLQQARLDAKYFQSAASTASYLRDLQKNDWKADKVPYPAQSQGLPRISEKVTSLQIFTLGNFLATLGLLSVSSVPRDGTKLPYTLSKWEDLTKSSFLSVFQDALNLADGIPLYLSSSKPDLGKSDLQFKPSSIALQLASTASTATSDSGGRRFGLRGAASNVGGPTAATKDQGSDAKGETQPPGATDQGTGKTASATVKWWQLGNWFSVDSQEDNWFRRLLPTINPGSGAPMKPLVGSPGIGFYPFAFSDGRFELNWQVDLISFGIDVEKAKAADGSAPGLISTPYFKLDSGEARVALVIDFGGSDILIAGGILLKDIRLDLSNKASPKDTSAPEDDMGASLQQLFAEPGEPTGGTQPAPAKPVPAFSLSCGYLYSEAYKTDQWDFQLYDSNGKRGEVAWVTVQRQVGPFTLGKIGFGLRKLETDNPELTVLIEGSLKFGNFELDLIGAGAALPLKNMSAWYPVIQGVAFSLNAGTTYIEGGFLKRQGYEYGEDGTPKQPPVTQYAGFVSIRPFNKFTIEAMGAWGRLADGATTLFIYGMLPLGKGVGNAVFKVTGLALGAGVNRRVKEPPMSQIADFPLVRAVMGTANLILKRTLSSTPADPGQVLAVMADELPIEEGAYFGCFGLRFSIVEVVDCFALGIVDIGSELEILLLGLARVKQPTEGQAICYLELALKAAVKPSEGSLLIQGQLTPSSWVLSESCQLTGGFAVAFWYGGSQAGDFVVTVGGYHPRFARPDHYPIVPRLGLNWNVTSDLLIKGGMYFALTPSAMMAGGNLEALFRAGPISARFLAYADFLVQWKPLHYDIAIGIEIHVSVDLWLFTVGVTVGVDLALMGPPVHGVATVDLSIASFTIEFGEPSPPPPFLERWTDFGKLFLAKAEQTAKEAEQTVKKVVWEISSGQESTGEAVALARVDCARGIHVKQGAADSGKAPASATTNSDPSAPWVVRADELILTAATLVPVTTFRLLGGKGLSGDSGPTIENLPDRNKSGQFLVLPEAISLQDGSTDFTEEKGAPIGIRPMDLRDFQSTLTMAIVIKAEEGEEETVLNLQEWECVLDKTSCPAALWDTQKADLGTPSAKVIPDCIVGMSLKPPAGKADGQSVGPFTLQRDDLGDRGTDPAGMPQGLLRPESSSVATTQSLISSNPLRSQLLSSLQKRGFTLPQEQPKNLRDLYATPLSGRLSAS